MPAAVAYQTPELGLDALVAEAALVRAGEEPGRRPDGLEVLRGLERHEAALVRREPRGLADEVADAARVEGAPGLGHGPVDGVLVVRHGQRRRRAEEPRFAAPRAPLVARRDAPQRRDGAPAWNSNLQPDFNVRICDSFGASSSAGLRELDESNRFVQKSAESTSM